MNISRGQFGWDAMRCYVVERILLRSESGAWNELRFGELSACQDFRPGVQRR